MKLDTDPVMPLMSSRVAVLVTASAHSDVKSFPFETNAFIRHLRVTYQPDSQVPWHIGALSAAVRDPAAYGLSS